MLEAPLPSCEAERLAALRDYDVLDTPSEQAFDDLTRLAASWCQTPIALVSLVDDQCCVVLFRYFAELSKRRNVAIHAEHTVGNDPYVFVVMPLSAQDLVYVFGVTMSIDHTISAR